MVLTDNGRDANAPPRGITVGFGLDTEREGKTQERQRRLGGEETKRNPVVLAILAHAQAVS